MLHTDTMLAGLILAAGIPARIHEKGEIPWRCVKTKTVCPGMMVEVGEEEEEEAPFQLAWMANKHEKGKCGGGHVCK